MRDRQVFLRFLRLGPSECLLRYGKRACKCGLRQEPVCKLLLLLMRVLIRGGRQVFPYSGILFHDPT